MRGMVQAGFGAMPLVTRVVVVFQLLGFIIGASFPQVIPALCLQPATAIMYFQLHRLFTYAVIHRNLIHFVLNMIGLLMVSSRLETSMGSVRYAHMFLAMTAVVAVTYCMGAALAYLIVGINFSFWNICTIGLTSPLLTMAVIYVYCFSTSSSVISVYGLQMPPTILPPLMLICTHFLPTTSFWCNFTGLVMGYMYVQGVVQQRMQLSRSAVLTLESSTLGQRLSTWNTFVRCPDAALPTRATTAASASSSSTGTTTHAAMGRAAASDSAAGRGGGGGSGFSGDAGGFGRGEPSRGMQLTSSLSSSSLSSTPASSYARPYAAREPGAAVTAPLSTSRGAGSAAVGGHRGQRQAAAHSPYQHSQQRQQRQQRQPPQQQRQQQSQQQEQQHAYFQPIERFEEEDFDDLAQHHEDDNDDDDDDDDDDELEFVDAREH
ncbi:hypothetical protein PTSG_09492 [Salpingoeca rosetta]|uniref:Peptidase S54 rhomboid domain-containing protein n=1 Tax=Salpingoeca rosetta (strain ATCC 50818 / BSB-021) TaxID=946362 RepID=F2UL59_SALR5|nr:uncharacterized protein PTSG_09492 [Salpingoeca rosetta]EGD77858.1 hypothetical protein PTSG_09492 [Salpingoeca rosetta]|eukprot:XP_004989922.1 hypothetical protein PTSG_09492 [Salpingoeca rosetta]